MLVDRTAFESALIPVPADPRAWPEFIQALRDWHQEKRSELRYDPKLYDREDLRWMARSFSLVHVMMNEEESYCPTENRYRVDEFLDRGERDFGGYDCALLWHAYPRIGIDEDPF